MRDKRNLFLGIGFCYVMKYLVRLLSPIMNNHSERPASNVTAVLSVIPGSTKQWVWTGKAVKELYYVVTGGGGMSNAISVITQNGKCQMCVSCDEAYFPNDTHKSFIKDFELFFEQAVDSL